MARLKTSERKDLPDSAFAYIDAKGRRRLPINDEAHVRNALARFERVAFEDDAARERARNRLLKAAKRYGIVPVGFITGQIRSERAPRPADRQALPTGIVTFLKTDIEGSTELLRRLGRRYPSVLSETRRVLRRAVRSSGGHEVDAHADEYFASFRRTSDALDAALAIQRMLSEHTWPDGVEVRVRAGVHGGRPTLTDTGYVGLSVHTVARISSAGHGGQILVSDWTKRALKGYLPVGVRLRSLGRHPLSGLPKHEALFQVVAKGLPADFPPSGPSTRHNSGSGPATLASHEPRGGATSDTAIERARTAITRQDWADAYTAFHDADRTSMTGADLEAFADAAWWCSKLPEALQIRKEAYAAYDAEGNDAAAGWMAARLAIEHFIGNEPAVGGGFLMRAQRHAAQLPPGREHGFLAMLEATVALNTGDLEGSLTRIEDAVRIGREVGDPELTAMAIHTQGLAMIDTGHVQEGLALLDEAMASTVAGEVGPYFTGIIYCSLLSACLAIGDLRRAGEWSDAAVDWCATIPPDSPYPGMCRANRAEVARLRGAWGEAEAEAERACDELLVIEPRFAAAAYLQLAEIRRRRGDLAGAEAAYTKAHEFGEDPQPGFALLRLAQGKPAAARAAIAAALGAAGPARPHQVRLHAANVEIVLADGAIDDARASAAELGRIAEETRAPAFAAQAAEAAGSVALASGDVDGALAQLRQACTTWQELRLPYEASRARVGFGRALAAAGDEEGATLELRAALAGFERLGAVRDAGEVAGLLGTPDALPDGLTPREAEVLRLLASGKTNRDIAVELVISEHTVGRHLQNLYAKLGVSSRSAATAYAFEHGLT